MDSGLIKDDSYTNYLDFPGVNEPRSASEVLWIMDQIMNSQVRLEFFFKLCMFKNGLVKLTNSIVVLDIWCRIIGLAFYEPPYLLIID